MVWYIWWPTNKLGAEIALFASLTVLWYIWWPTNKLGAEIALFTKKVGAEIYRTSHHSDCGMVHLVAN